MASVVILNLVKVVENRFALLKTSVTKARWISILFVVFLAVLTTFSPIVIAQSDNKDKGKPKLGITVKCPIPKEVLLDSKVKVTVAATSTTNQVDDIVDDLHVKWMSKNGFFLQEIDVSNWLDGGLLDEYVEANFKQHTFETTAEEPGKWEVWIRFTKKESTDDTEGKTIEQSHCKFTVIEPASLERKPHIDIEIIQMDLRGAGPIVVPPPDLPRD
jgi:hypothetical protein